MPDSVKREYIEKFLIQMANVGTSGDDDTISQKFLLVLNGRQGVGKSIWLRSLVPNFFGTSYFKSDCTCNRKIKNPSIEQSSVLLIEWVDLMPKDKKNAENIKAYITSPYDFIKMPYTKDICRIKRRMCLCSSTADESFQYEVDDPYIAVIYCNEINYMHNVDMDGVWGQVWRQKMNGAQFCLAEDSHLDPIDETL
ncbi:MAG: virulence-associated E family protein [Clostridiales bacterium]|jgi:predicted P-loop ATPase|nr:virulence-associated E family protein [Clostridiales bacterium]